MAINPSSTGPWRRLITTDNHLVPPPWLVNELPERLQQVLRFSVTGYEERDGQRFLKTSGATEMMRPNVASEVHVGGVGQSLAPVIKALNNFSGVDAMPWFDPKGRLEDMRRENVVAAVLIGDPSVGLRRSPIDLEAQAAYCRIVNDWQIDTYKDYFDIFAPGIYLPFLDPAVCVKELERCAAAGLRHAVMPDYIWDAPYADPQWEAVWEAANALKIPLTLHISGLRHRPADEAALANSYPGRALSGFYAASVGMGETLAEFSLAGVFQKYPDLHVVMTEGSAFWLAGLMLFLDHYWANRYGAMLNDRYSARTVNLEMSPSFYIKRQGHATFMYDPLAIRMRGETGLDCLLWGNDYPHTEGLFPDSQAYVEEQFAGVSEEEIEKITFSNAAKLYSFAVAYDEGARPS
jgi:predicted TIM-barrel fold metal-dependent hydrolase